MSRNTRLIAATAAVVLVAGGGAALAAVELTGSSHSTRALPAPAGFGDGNGLGSGGGDLGGGRYGDGGGRPGGDFGGRPGGGFFSSLGAAATYLGLSSTALQSELQNGKTLAQVAQAQGKAVTGLVAAMVAAQRKQLDAAVSGGQLTQAQETRIAPFLAQRVHDLVNGTRPGGFGRGFGGGNDDNGGQGGGSGGSGTFGGSTA